ncbi:structural protein [Ambidensovirus_Croatia_17_S17]|uniref:Structural protein n=1 Tax=Ambidensovirus_Croatia_17_S17 TaxID=3070156 RepID=A0A6C0PV90_9VIRU|nr:structural protein [Ambidensovirus_Croatia_17_S17]QHY93495.1 structural protein [Ambidensovirus_Croatia_17_S17]
MGEYIVLDGFNSGSSSASTSTETLFQQPTERTSLLNRSRVHPGYGASKLPLRPTGAAGAAGSQYDAIFQSQLGRAAATGNPLGLFKHRDAYYASVPFELRRLPLADRQKYIKPYNVPWNKETKTQFRQHWRLVNPRAGQKRLQQQQQAAKQKEVEANRAQANLARGEPTWYGKALTLPLSKNLGPGNRISPATNTADVIAQGHDLHYQDAKKDSDVLQADREAINQFTHEAIQGSDPVSRLHAAVGAVGLGIKHTVESLTGKVIYGELICQDAKNLLVLIPGTDQIGIALMKGNGVMLLNSGC